VVTSPLAIGAIDAEPDRHGVAGSLSSTDVDFAGAAQCSEVIVGPVSTAGFDKADAKQVLQTVEESISIERVAQEDRQGLQVAGELHEPVAWADLQLGSRERERRAAVRFFGNVNPLPDDVVPDREEAQTQSSLGSSPDSDSDDDTDNLQDGGDEEWISFLTDSDVGSLLAASWRLSAVAAVHVTHLAMEDLSTGRA
jgi:hypothetical protein